LGQHRQENEKEQKPKKDEDEKSWDKRENP